jgi:hypothetical protein
MENMKEVLLEGETVYLKKGIFGWNVVEPLWHPQTKKFQWENFLNKKGFVVLGFLLILLLFSYLAFQEQLENYQSVVQNPCAYCIDCQEQTKEVISQIRNKEVKTTRLDFNITQ